MSQSPNSTQAPAPIRCLIVQLSDLSDLLQSLMALKAAKELYPHLEIHLVAKETIAIAAKRVPWIAQVFELSQEAILATTITPETSDAPNPSSSMATLASDRELPQDSRIDSENATAVLLKTTSSNPLSPKHVESIALAQLTCWIAPLLQQPWDLVANWSFSEPSSYLTAAIPSKVKLGYTRRNDLSLFGSDGWSRYVQAIVQENIKQNIHPTDILTTQLLTALQINFGAPRTDGNTRATSKDFFSLVIDQNKLNTTSQNKTNESKERKESLHSSNPVRKWIGIQLLSENNPAAWSARNWAALIQIVLSRHPGYGFYLFGTNEAVTVGQTILSEVGQASLDLELVVSYVGETDFDHWTTLLSQCQWLISENSPAVHLASVLGVRVLNLSTDPKLHRGNGPYGNGHYVVTGNFSKQVSHSPSTLQEPPVLIVSPEAVYATWSYANSEWTHRRKGSIATHFSQFGWSYTLEAVQIYRSKVRSATDGGGVTFEPLLNNPLSLEDWSSLVMGHIARSWYCGWVPETGQDLSRESIHPPLIQKLRELHASIEVLSKLFAKATQTSLLLHKKTKKLKSSYMMSVSERDEIQSMSGVLSDLDGLVDRLTQTHPSLRCFSQMSKVLMHDLESNQLTDLSIEASRCYKQLNEGALIFRKWIHYTLELSKPKAIELGPITQLNLPLQNPNGPNGKETTS